MSTFNRRFTGFYYNMPKEVQPLENTAKIYYAAAFPPNLSLLLLERKSTTCSRCSLISWRLRKTKLVYGSFIVFVCWGSIPLLSLESRYILACFIMVVEGG